MANSLLTIDMITAESLRILSNSLQLAKTVKRDFDDEFAQKGAKIGTTLRIRVPNQFTTATGAALSLQDVTEQYVNLAVDQQFHADFTFDSGEMTLKIDQFANRYIKPAAVAVANQIEAYGFRKLTPLVYNYVGTPGSTPSALSTILAAERKLDECLAPMDDSRAFNVSPATNMSMAATVSTLFNPQRGLSDTYETGYVNRQAGFKWLRTNLGWTFTPGLSGTGQFHPGATSNNPYSGIFGVSGLSGPSTVVSAGTVFTIGSVYQVNAQTKGVYSNLQQFTVTADSTLVGGAGVVYASPSIVTSGAWQNVNSAPAAGAAFTVVSNNANAFGPMKQNLAYHPDFAAFANIPMVLPDGVDMAARATDEGVSTRIIRQYLIATDTIACRLDTLFGFGMLRPQLAVRITE